MCLLTGSQMPFTMVDYPDAVWNKQQFTQHLTRTTQLLQSGVFEPTVPFTHHTQARWIELILAVSDLVRQAALAGKRIDFTDGVPAYGKPQDVTSLLDSLRQSAYVVDSGAFAGRGLTILSPTFNHFHGVGAGCFANGLSFTCTHENETTFFIGRQQVYFYRHLMRAFMEAQRYLRSVLERE